VLPSFQDLFDPVFFAKALPAAHKLDLQSILRGDSLQVLAKLLSQRLGSVWVIEGPQLVPVKIVGHPAGVTPARYRELNEDPVITGKNAHDLVFVPFGQQLDAHSGIVMHSLFGSGYPGLGTRSLIIQFAATVGVFAIADLPLDTTYSVGFYWSWADSPLR